MMDLLNFEADCQAIQVVYNSLTMDFNSSQEEERRKVIPFFWKLYPTITNQLVKCNSLEMLKDALT